MKKKMSTKGMMILAVGIAMASCSKSDVFEQNQTNFSEQQKAEYVSNYVAKYGQPDANQSWDFAAAVPNASKTRAGETMVCTETRLPKFFYEHVVTDGGKFANKIANAEVKDWNPYMSVWLVPCAVHTTDKELQFGLSVFYNGQVTNIANGLRIEDNVWAYNLDPLYDFFTDAVFSRGRNIDTRGLVTAENVYWSAYNYNYEWTWGFLWGEWKEAGFKSFEIKTYKEITVNGRTYWCFDCTNDGDYSNLVCLAVDAVGLEEQPKPIQKRYMVEDLGSKDDFDFNDIVFDVIDDNGSQKCIVRAMGGTIDFTLKIGNTTWTKSVEGLEAGYNTKTMYNTQGTIEYDKVLAEFTVTGWNPETNNISVEVKSAVSDDVIIEIPFPKQGEVPMILAFPAVTNWQAERASLPEDWWYIPEEISEED